jgi:hypothetical protein
MVAQPNAHRRPKRHNRRINMLNDYVIAKWVNSSLVVDGIISQPYKELRPVENAPSLGEIVEALQAADRLVKDFAKHFNPLPTCDCLTCTEVRPIISILAQLTALEEKA